MLSVDLFDLAPINQAPINQAFPCLRTFCTLFDRYHHRNRNLKTYLEYQGGVLEIFYMSRHKLNTFEYRYRCKLDMWSALRSSPIFSRY